LGVHEYVKAELAEFKINYELCELWE